MSPLEKLRNGIINNDMAEVAESYSKITGEDLSSLMQEPNNGPSHDDVIKALGSYLSSQKKSSKSPKKKAIQSNPKVKIKEEEDDGPPIVNRSNVGKSPGPVKAGKPYLPYNSSYDKQEARANAENVIEKQHRPKYKPHMKDCTECKQPFDIKKSYGILPNENTSIWICNTCQNKRPMN
jgi:hypothetical protein